MEYDYSWDALTKPGESDQYFNLTDPPALKADTTDFNVGNAWWLAEISRLIYHDNFHKDKMISFGDFSYEKITFIDNQQTSTKAALLKAAGIDKNRKKTSCLILVFRGTDELEDWYTNVHAYQTSFGDSGLIHDGFKTAYLSIKNELYDHLENNSRPLFITGHSLGAALATLATSELYCKSYFDSCYTFGSPKVGNDYFASLLINKRIFRIINNIDVVTMLPLDFATIKYTHCGEPHVFMRDTGYTKGLSDDEILTFQKQQIHGLKEYAKNSIFSRQIKNIGINMPAFLADHAPINYVVAVAKLLSEKRLNNKK